MMNIDTDFDFTIYDHDPIVKDNTSWYFSPMYAHEIAQLPLQDECILLTKWGNDMGGDYAISEKLYNWLVMKYDTPHVDLWDDDLGKLLRKFLND